MAEITRRQLVGSILIGATASTLQPMAAAATASTPLTIPLYPGEIPNAIAAADEEATRDPSEAAIFRQNISRPTLSVHLPQRADSNRAAVIICPGGSYRGVSIEKEGHSVARAFNEFGVAAIVLKYRTPSARHMKDTATGPLQDAQQAIHVVRQRASEWHIDAKRIGLVGFSAGGHLASTAATHFAQPVLAEHRGANLRPDFSVLLYPVISMGDELTHPVSRQQLLGASPSAELIERYSNELAVSDATPPAFIMHAADDTGVDVRNSLRYFEALHARKISAQLLVYPQGGHGFGLNNATTTDRWIDRARQWMLSQQWLAKSLQAAL